MSVVDDAIGSAHSTNATYFATRWAAIVLKMRVLMMHGNEADYPSVITMADEIISTGPYQLEDNVKDIFYTKGITSNEVILAIKPQPNQEFGYHNLSGSYFPDDSYLYVTTPYYQGLMQSGPRADWVIGPYTPYQNYSPGTKYFNK